MSSKVLDYVKVLINCSLRENFFDMLYGKCIQYQSNHLYRPSKTTRSSSNGDEEIESSRSPTPSSESAYQPEPSPDYNRSFDALLGQMSSPAAQTILTQTRDLISGNSNFDEDTSERTAPQTGSYDNLPTPKSNTLHKEEHAIVGAETGLRFIDDRSTTAGPKHCK